MSQSDPGAAIVGHREQIAAEPRPTRLGEAPINVEVEDLWRVYRPEWLIVYVTEDDADGQTRMSDHFQNNFAGRVKEHDARRVVDGEPPNAVLQLQIRKPNMRGEFKHHSDAEAFVAEQGWTDATIVTRNSREDHELRAYGTKRLPA
jgi:hypothetical protein